MQSEYVWLIILLVVGIVVSNLMALKYSSKLLWRAQQETDKAEHKKADTEASADNHDDEKAE